MTVTLQVYIEDIDDVLADGFTTLRLYRDTTPDGAFSTLVTSETLVEGQEYYSLTDSAGSVSHWYRHDFYDGSTSTAKSPPYRSEAIPLVTLRVMVAARMGAGFHSTCTANGTVSALIDASLRDDGEDASYLEGAWIYRPSAADADKLRRTANSPFTPASGALRPVRDWSVAPSSGEVYQVFTLLRPVAAFGSYYSYTEAINEALAEPVIDMLDLGEGTTTGKKDFSLGPHLWGISPNDIRAVYLRTTDDNGIHTYLNADKEGRFTKTFVNGPGQLSVEVTPPPAPDETVIVEVNRRYPPLYDDDDVTEAPVDHVVRCAAWKAYQYLDSVFDGRYEQQAAKALASWLEIYRGIEPTPVVRGL